VKKKNCGKKFAYLRNLRQHDKVQHQGISVHCPMHACSTTFTCQSSLCRHLLKIHTTEEIHKQIVANKRHYPNKSHRRYDIKNLLSGFNHRSLHKQSSEMMKQLLDLFSSNDVPSFEFGNENIMAVTTEKEENSHTVHPLVLNGYNDIGLLKLN